MTTMKNTEYKGIKLLKPLYHAIPKKQVLNIQYKGFKDNKIHKYVFHPYILKQYNRRWFVFGNSYSNKIKEWSTPLDDIPLVIRMLYNVSYIKLQADWSNLFRTQVGVIRPKDARIERVVLRFYNSRETYFKTTLFQPDYVEFFEEDKQNQVWFDTIINRELVQQLLSYGGDVKVLGLVTSRSVYFNWLFCKKY